MKIRGQIVYDPIDRINRLTKIDPFTKCWNWIGSKRNGYGRLIIGSRTLGTRRSVSAHRYSFEIFKGAIPNELFVCHHCDNPSCVNPDHLFVGTRQDNVDDRERKGRNIKPPLYSSEQHPSAIHTLVEIKCLRAAWENWDGSITALAAVHKVDRRWLSDVLNNKRWIRTSLPPAPEAESK